MKPLPSLSSAPSPPAPWANNAAAVLLTLAISLFCFSPKFLIIAESLENSYELWRARTFLHQCENPLAQDIDLELRWRLLPPAVCHALGLRGSAALAVPWCGVVALLGYCTVVFRRAGLDGEQTFLGAIFVGTTSAVIVPLNWLGYNDAWVWLGLLTIAFGRAKVALAAACLLCPWIDERFVIGFPLAVAVRCLRPDFGQQMGGRDLAREFSQLGIWLFPYFGVRVGSRLFVHSDVTNALLHRQLSSFVSWAHYGPIGWWMGLRAGWWLLWPVARHARSRTPKAAIGFAVVVLLSCTTMLVLAADISRSAAIVLPTVILGILLLAQRPRTEATRHLRWLVGFNLLVPTAHVVGNVIALISPLPIELLRLLRWLWNTP
jgi:hypothetical protein